MATLAERAQMAARCVTRLAKELRTRFPEDPADLEPLIRSSLHANEADPRDRAIARALFIACLYEADMNLPAQKRRIAAMKATRALARKVREWHRMMAPIVAENETRNQRMGNAAQMFPAHAIPWWVNQLGGVEAALAVTANLLDYQRMAGEPTLPSRGRPMDLFFREITNVLRAGGLSHRQVAKFTDDDSDGRASERARHRARAKPRKPRR